MSALKQGLRRKEAVVDLTEDLSRWNAGDVVGQDSDAVQGSVDGVVI